MEFCVYCPGSGINLTHGRNLISQDFAISNENLEQSTTKTIPKFRFFGKITSVNCNFMEPFDGYIIKSHSELQIKSVEI